MQVFRLCWCIVGHVCHKISMCFTAHSVGHCSKTLGGQLQAAETSGGRLPRQVPQNLSYPVPFSRFLSIVDSIFSALLQQDSRQLQPAEVPFECLPGQVPGALGARPQTAVRQNHHRAHRRSGFTKKNDDGSKLKWPSGARAQAVVRPRHHCAHRRCILSS